MRLVKGANLPMERVEAEVHGWPVATCDSKQATDTNYKRVLDYALRPERIGNVRLGVAGHNLFDVAYAWVLAGKRDVRAGIEFEMLLGMAEGQAEAVRREVGGLLLYTPVVRPEQFDVAIAYRDNLGAHVAQAFMRETGVPEALAGRVLAGAATARATAPRRWSPRAVHDQAARQA